MCIDYDDYDDQRNANKLITSIVAVIIFGALIVVAERSKSSEEATPHSEEATPHSEGATPHSEKATPHSEEATPLKAKKGEDIKKLLKELTPEERRELLKTIDINTSEQSEQNEQEILR